jgi:hypothetical protein
MKITDYKTLSALINRLDALRARHEKLAASKLPFIEVACVSIGDGTHYAVGGPAAFAAIKMMVLTIIGAEIAKVKLDIAALGIDVSNHT